MPLRPWPLGCLPLPISWLRRHIPPTAGPLTFPPQRATGAAPHPNSWGNAPQSLGMTLHANPLYRACWYLDQQAGCQAGSTPHLSRGTGSSPVPRPTKMVGGRGREGDGFVERTSTREFQTPQDAQPLGARSPFSRAQPNHGH